MLDQLDRDLERRGVCLLLARDIGQVRDVVRRASDDPDLARVFPTVQDAVDAAQRGC
jgi:SulP family sulfate permease